MKTIKKISVFLLGLPLIVGCESPNLNELQIKSLSTDTSIKTISVDSIYTDESELNSNKWREYIY
ncbi:MAG: hypothetical protein ACJAWV_000916 [Flammeovirgaceae bacterium]|jgi:uncharacterized protein YcfL